MKSRTQQKKCPGRAGSKSDHPVASASASMIQKINRTVRPAQLAFQFCRPSVIRRNFTMRQRSDYPTFSDAEIQRRHQVVYGLMEQEGVTALLFYGSGRYASDIYWLSDWPSSRE